MPHLSREQLEQLTQRWETWEAESVTPARRLGRSRLHLLFLLIRYGGLRLGEALEINPRHAVDTTTGMVSVPEPNARDVMLPMPAMRHVRRILSLPAAEEMGAEFLKFDQGFIRKKFYAVAQPLGVDPALSGPRAIRYARGLELLHMHVPLNLVQKILGQQKPSQLAAFLDFSDGEARRVVQTNVLNKSAHVGSHSAALDIRNSFLGIVTAVDVGMRSASVEVTTFSDVRIVALDSVKNILRVDPHEGQVVTVIIDPERIVLASEKFSSSLANGVSGTVETLHLDPVESFVTVALPDGTRLNVALESSALEKLRLREGKKVFAFFSSRAVRLCLD